MDLKPIRNSRDPCFFWVSSLAYPNLLGTKGYVVVIVCKIIIIIVCISKKGNDKTVFNNYHTITIK